MGSSGERILHVRTVRAFRWPTLALALLLSILFICASVTVGTYAYFSYVQGRLMVVVPWSVSPSTRGGGGVAANAAIGTTTF